MLVPKLYAPHVLLQQITSYLFQVPAPSIPPSPVHVRMGRFYSPPAQWLTTPPARPPRCNKHPPRQTPSCPLVWLAGCRWVGGRAFYIHSRWSPRQSPSSQHKLLEASPASQPHWDWSLPADRSGAQSLLPPPQHTPHAFSSANLRHEWSSSIRSGTLPKHPGKWVFAQIKKERENQWGIFSQIWCKYSEKILYI